METPNVRRSSFLLIVMIPFILFSHSRLYSYPKQDDDGSQPQLDTSNVDKVISDWKKDSMACLKLRNYLMADFLVRLFAINQKNQQEVIKLFGNPNKSYYKKISIRDPRIKQRFLVMRYYFDAYCKDGKPVEKSDGLCWLDIIIDPKTRKVVHTGKSCT